MVKASLLIVVCQGGGCFVALRPRSGTLVIVSKVGGRHPDRPLQPGGNAASICTCGICLQASSTPAICANALCQPVRERLQARSRDRGAVSNSAKHAKPCR